MASAFDDGPSAVVAAGGGALGAAGLFGDAVEAGAARFGAEGEGAQAPTSASMAAKRTGRIMGATLAQIRVDL